MWLQMTWLTDTEWALDVIGISNRCWWSCGSRMKAAVRCMQAGCRASAKHPMGSERSRRGWQHVRPGWMSPGRCDRQRPPGRSPLHWSLAPHAAACQRARRSSPKYPDPPSAGAQHSIRQCFVCCFNVATHGQCSSNRSFVRFGGRT